MRSLNRRLAVALVLVLVPVAALQAADTKIVPDVVYGHKDGMALTFDVFKPERAANGAGVLFMVSGGWRSAWAPPEQAMERFRPLLDRGFTVFAVRHGSSPKYVIPEIVEDVRRSVRYIRLNAAKFGVDPDRLGVFGGSAGGHLSLVLGTASDSGQADAKDEVLRVSDRVAAVVAYFPPTDLRTRVLEPPAKNDRFPALNFERDKAPDFSPIVHVTPDDPPTLLIHGDQDTLVPLNDSETMFAELQRKGVPTDLIVIKGAGHGFRGEHATQAATAMAAWFEKHLTKNGASESK